MDYDYRKSFLAVTQTWNLCFCLNTSLMIHVRPVKFHTRHGLHNQVLLGQQNHALAHLGLPANNKAYSGFQKRLFIGQKITFSGSECSFNHRGFNLNAVICMFVLQKCPLCNPFWTIKIGAVHSGRHWWDDRLFILNKKGEPRLPHSSTQTLRQCLLTFSAAR